MSINKKDLININKSCNGDDEIEYTYINNHMPTCNTLYNHKLNTDPCFNKEIKSKRVSNMIDSASYAKKYKFKINKPCENLFQLQFQMPLLGTDNRCPNILNFSDYSTFDRENVISSMSKIKNVKTNPNLFNDISTLSYSSYTC